MHRSQGLMRSINILISLPLMLTIAGEAMSKTYSDPALGFSINIPDSLSSISQEGDIYYFTAPDLRSTVIIKNWPGLTAEDVREASRSGYHVQGMSLNPAGNAKETSSSKGWSMRFDVTGTIDITGVRGVLSGHVGKEGQGFIMLIASVPDLWKSFSSTSTSIHHSIAFTEYSGDDIVREWRRYLTGKRMRYMRTISGSSTDESYFLCSDGSFSETSSSSNYTSGGGVSVYGQGSGSNYGRWEIQPVNGQAHMILQYPNGEVYRMLLEDRDGKTIMNGSRYFVVENDRCQ